MQERRGSVRLGSWLYASYQIDGAGKAFCTLTRNIGQGGIGLFTERAFKPGTTLVVEVKLLNEPSVTFTGRVTWSEPMFLRNRDDEPRAFETGLQFINISPDDQKRILLHTLSNPPPLTGGSG